LTPAHGVIGAVQWLPGILSPILLAQRIQRRQMAAGEIDDVNAIPHAGAVRGGVVSAEECAPTELK